jgi:hypothetical protein
VTTLGAASATNDDDLLVCHGVGPNAVRMIRQLRKGRRRVYGERVISTALPRRGNPRRR